MKHGGHSKSIDIAGTGKQMRDLLYVEDAKCLYAVALEKIESARGDVFNKGGGAERSLSLLELFSLLEQFIGVEIEYREKPVRLSDPKVFISNNGGAKSIRDWESLVPNKSGLLETVSAIGSS